MTQGTIPEVVNLADEASRLTESWSPKVVAQLNGQFVKVAKLHGEFVWHDHAAEDELFLILKGRLVIKFEAGEVSIGEGECCVVPRGLSHNTVAVEECWVALFEPATTAHTGGVITDRTRSIEEQLDK
jgi:mannose-6-phosphate isomerase-like protein (cupin superfamily)